MRNGARLASDGDLAWAALLAGATALYLAALPRDLFTGDEGRFLYEAKRLLDGDVPYRDFFDFITPGLLYLLALAFRIFGASIATAKITMAIVHGLTVGVIFLVCRALRVRPVLAGAAALTHVTLCQPAWSYVSPHWLATLLSLCLLLVVLAVPWDRQPAGTALLGAVAGLLILVLQHKGTQFAAGVCLLLLLGWLVDRRFDVSTSLGAQLGWYLCALVLVVAPVLALLVVRAGFAPVFDALVVFPLVGYRAFNHAPPWGAYAPFMERWGMYTFPTLLAYTPVILVLPAARALRCWNRREGRDELRQLLALVLFGAISIWSASNFPDVVHVAFIAPVFAIVAALEIEYGLRLVPLRSRPLAGAAVSSLLLAALGVQLVLNTERRLREFPIAHDTAFGRVAFHDPGEVTLLEAVRDRLRDAPSREMYCYQACAGMYLLSGSVNPTRHQWLQPGYQRPEWFQETIASLEANRVPLVVAGPLIGPDDAIMVYLAQHYELVDLGLGAVAPRLYRRVRS